MAKGIVTDAKEALTKALKIGETFTVKELGVPYSALKQFIDDKLVVEKGKRAQEGRGRNPVEFAVTAKGKKVATAAPKS